MRVLRLARNTGGKTLRPLALPDTYVVRQEFKFFTCVEQAGSRGAGCNSLFLTFVSSSRV